MSLNNPKAGAHSANDYQVVGLPWVTGSTATTTPQQLSFPKVTRAITVRNNDNSNLLYIGFTQNGVTGSNRFAIPSGDSDRFEVRTKVLWLQSDASTVDYSVLAELTLIDGTMFPILTGSTTGDADGNSWKGVG